MFGRRHLTRRVTPVFVLLACALGRPHALADANTSEAAARVAETRDNWLRAFKSKDVTGAISYYAPDATFLQPTGDRIEGTEAIRALYRKVVDAFDTDLVLRSRKLEASCDLAFDSGEYEETLTSTKSGEKQHFRGQYLMVFRKADGGWKIIQHVWTVAPNPS